MTQQHEHTCLGCNSPYYCAEDPCGPRCTVCTVKAQEKQYDPRLKNLVAFCLVMEQRGGIIEKPPATVIAMFEKYCCTNRDDEWQWGMDAALFKTFGRYGEKHLEEKRRED